jgi:regulator of sigma D
MGDTTLTPAQKKISFKTKDGREVSFDRTREKTKGALHSRKLRVARQINQFLVKNHEKMTKYQLNHLEKSLLKNDTLDFQQAVNDARSLQLRKHKVKDLCKSKIWLPIVPDVAQEVTAPVDE